MRLSKRRGRGWRPPPPLDEPLPDRKLHYRATLPQRPSDIEPVPRPILLAAIFVMALVVRLRKIAYPARYFLVSF